MLTQNKSTQNTHSIEWITANAGSGKTSYLLSKIECLEHTLCLTFSNACADEINNRINNTHSTSSISTLHAFCLKLLTEYNPYYSLIDAHSTNILWNIALEHALTQAVITPSIISKLHKLEKPNTYTMLHTFKGELEPLHKLLLEHFNNLKAKECLLTFDDILIQTIKLLDNNLAPHILHKHLGHKKILCIDEAQDLSYMQWKVVFALMQELLQLNQMHIYITGDEKQSIYSFQGACLDNYQKAKLACKQMCDDMQYIQFKQTKLEQTHRMPQQLCTLVDKIFQNAEQHIWHTTHISSINSSEGNHFEILNIENHTNINQTNDWIQSLVNKIKQLHTLYKPNQMKILIRKRNQIYQQLCQKLNDHNIPTTYQNLEDMRCFLLNLCTFFHTNEQYYFFKAQEYFEINLRRLPKTNNAAAIVQAVFSMLDFNNEQLLLIALNCHSLAQFIDQLSHISLEEKNDNAIQIQTIYQTKGQEAEVIFLCDTTLNLNQTYTDQIIHQNHIIDNENDEYEQLLEEHKQKLEMESDRLLYVGLTRAKNQLIIVPSPNIAAPENCWLTKIKNTIEKL